MRFTRAKPAACRHPSVDAPNQFSIGSVDISGSQIKMLHIRQGWLYSNYSEGLASISARTNTCRRATHKVQSCLCTCDEVWRQVLPDIALRGCTKNSMCQRTSKRVRCVSSAASCVSVESLDSSTEITTLAGCTTATPPCLSRGHLALYMSWLSYQGPCDRWGKEYGSRRDI